MYRRSTMALGLVLACTVSTQAGSQQSPPPPAAPALQPGDIRLTYLGNAGWEITGRLPDTGLTERFTALPMLIYRWSANADPTDATLSFSNAAASAGLVMLALVLLFNITAIVMRSRFEKRRVGQ